MKKMQKEPQVIRVAKTTSVSSLSGGIVKFFEEDEEVELRAMGAGATNQMYKAIASARKVIAQKGYNLMIIPGFDTIEDANGSLSPDGKKKEKTVLVARLVAM